jgi:hypothetical protein
MSGFKMDFSKLLNGVTMMDVKMQLAVEMFVDTKSQEIQSTAQENAVWTDRTGRARQGLKGTYIKTPKGYKIVLSHSVDYGMWLELANEKNYAIIEPTIKLSSPKIMRQFTGMMNKINVKV